MAYNSSKGPQQHGDVKYEGDPLDTQVDFENDFIALKTNGEQRFIVSGSYITSSIPLSCSVGITAASLDVAGTTINTTQISSSLNISASAFYADGTLVIAPPITTYNNAADNRVITSVNSSTVQGEAGLTYDGAILAATGEISASLGVSGSTGHFRVLNASSIVGGSPLDISASSVTITGSLTFSGSSTISASSATISALTASAVSGGSPISIYGDTITMVGGGAGSTIITSAHLSSSLHISGAAFYGDGSTLSGVGPGTMSSWTLSADAGSNQAISDGNTVDIAGGTGISTAASATDTVTVNLDDTSVSAGSYTYSAITVDAQGRLTAASSGTGPSVTTYNNATDNYVLTSAGAASINGEANLTFDGNILKSIGQISASLGVTGSSLRTATTVIDTTHLSSSLNISGSAFYANGVLLSASPVSAVANGVDNRVATFSSADALNGEANLTFDGTDLGVSDKIFHVGDTDTFINFTDDDINFQAGGVNFLDLTEDTQNEVTFNEGGVDVDFRVETADESHMLFVEGSSNRMSIGDNTGSPGATLEIKNHASAGATGVPLLQLNNNDTDQQCLDINAGNIDANVVNVTANDVTTARVLAIGADGLTTGNALYVDDNSPNTGTRNTALIIQNHTGAINAQALAVQSDGGKTGVKIDKNYSDLTEASVVGLDIDWDKTGASTSDNTMYGIQLDMDNTTATNGINTMYGLHVTPRLTHAADAGECHLWGINIESTAGTNGTSINTAGRLKATGGDINYGLFIDCGDGTNDVDFRIRSQADNADYFQIKTIANGATTISTVDGGASAAHLTCSVDGNIVLDPVGSNVIVDGNLSASINISASAFYGDGSTLSGVGPGTMSSWTLSADGGSNQAIADGNTVDIAGGTGITTAASATDTVTVNLDDTSVSAGSYTYSAITVDAQGRLTAASNGAAPSITTLNSAGANRILTSDAGSSATAEERLTFDSSTKMLFLSGNAEMRNHEPYIFFSNSAGTGLGYMGYNSSNNILFQNNTSNKHIVFKANDNGTIREGFRIDGGVPEVVVNQGSETMIDFRVESDNNTHMLYVAGTADKVGVNSDTPTHTLSVTGTLSVSSVAEVTGALRVSGKTELYNHMTFTDPTTLSADTGLGEVVYYGSEHGTDTLAAGKLMYLSGSTTGSFWRYADADEEVSAGPVQLGIALGTSVSDGILIKGYFHANTLGDSSTFVTGGTCYVGLAAGTISFTRPSAVGDVIRAVGHGIAAEKIIYFNPSYDWFQL